MWACQFFIILTGLLLSFYSQPPAISHLKITYIEAGWLPPQRNWPVQIGLVHPPKMGEIMTDLAAGEKIPWHSINTFFSRKLRILQIIANLAGAGIVTSYFMFFDPNLKIQDVTIDLIVIGIMFVALVLIATFFYTTGKKTWCNSLDLRATIRQWK